MFVFRPRPVSLPITLATESILSWAVNNFFSTGIAVDLGSQLIRWVWLWVNFASSGGVGIALDKQRQPTAKQNTIRHYIERSVAPKGVIRKQKTTKKTKNDKNETYEN
jgi:hypothetical protein